MNDLFKEKVSFVVLEAIAPLVEPPGDKRVPFGWGAAAVECTAGGGATRLKAASSPPVPPKPETELRAYLRLAIAVDVREEKQIKVTLPEDGKVIGIIDIRYAYVLQVFELPVEAADVPEVLRQGVELRMVRGEQPLWFFTDANGLAGEAALLPHLLIAGTETDKEQQFLQQLASVASVQPFGWMEGCVLDALSDLQTVYPERPEFAAALDQHLSLFLTESGELVYENPRSVPVDGSIYGIEGTLPFAVIAKRHPEHPVLELALRFWLSHGSGPDGVIADGTSITAEGAYTVAYPLAVLARLRGRDDLAELAISNLIHRMKLLQHEQGLCWINRQSNGEWEPYVNWGRAYAWYMLGLIRSIVELRGMERHADRVAELEQECLRIAQIALAHQRSDGLWSCMLNEPETGVDTSGSAGIAAAMAIGWRHGLLPDTMEEAAKRTYAGLLAYLTPDGLLGGVAQSNRNGEALQRSGYRVLSQMAMGLMGQLAAAIRG